MVYGQNWLMSVNVCMLSYAFSEIHPCHRIGTFDGLSVRRSERIPGPDQVPQATDLDTLVALSLSLLTLFHSALRLSLCLSLARSS